LAALGTLLVAVIAIWGEKIRSYLLGPKLEIEFKANEFKEPYYKRDYQKYDEKKQTHFNHQHPKVKLKLIFHTDPVWIRFRVINKGGSTAKNCEITICKIVINGIRQPRFDPAKLQWGEHDKGIGDIVVKPDGELVELALMVIFI
jgi:hypothetical protein